jgi:hypothetical protein
VYRKSLTAASVIRPILKISRIPRLLRLAAEAGRAAVGVAQRRLFGTLSIKKDRDGPKFLNGFGRRFRAAA